MEIGIAFTITLIAALLFCGLYMWNKANQKEEKVRTEAEMARLKAEVENKPLANGTPLTVELIKKAVEFNGFVPQDAEDGWIMFRYQGDKYHIKYEENLVQFYFGMLLNGNDGNVDLDLVERSAAIVRDKAAYGRVTVSDKDESGSLILSFRMYGFEMTYEHLCVAFMEYMNAIRMLIDAHQNEYQKLDQERQENAEITGSGDDYQVNNIHNTVLN